MFDFFEKILENLSFKLVGDFTNKLYSFIKEIKENSNGNNNDNGGDSAQIGSSGDFAKIGSSGNSAQIGSSGDFAKIGSSGDFAKIGSSGDSAQIGSSGNFAKIGSSGDSAQIGSSGNFAQIGSSGNFAQIGSSGNFAQIGSSGDSAQIDISGNNSIGFACGYKSLIKAKKGTWISLAEYEKDEENNIIPVFAKSAQIGNKNYKDFKGRILNENTYYILWKKEFYPVEKIDGIWTIKLSEKKRDIIKIIKAIDIDDIYIQNEIKELYIAKEKDLSAHGYTLREAIDDLMYKKLDNTNIDEIVLKIKKTGKVTRSEYKAITGACSYGTNKFCEKHNIQNLEEIEIKELRKILINDYGAQKFWSLIDNMEV